MGQHEVEQYFGHEKLQAFMAALLDDLRALDYLIDHDLIESDVHRVGAEQEMFLVDPDLRAAPIATQVLAAMNEPRVTTEIARFNLELNLTPQTITGDCFSLMEQELNQLIANTREHAAQFGADTLLAGILPTLERSDLTLANLSPQPRYHELNRAVTEARGGPFLIRIKGVDDLEIEHDNIMMESCNTSFQIHFQVGPREFAQSYNIAQAITAPVLAAAVNSPILFGKRLWHETRLALFQHSTDARTRAQLARSMPTRVGLGERWVKTSVLELLQDQVARFRPIMINLPPESSLEVLARGEIPELAALFMHNGTIWPWNRACYGVQNGIAHLRIENRALPAGPTVLDEIANTAFFIGLMLALPQEYGDITTRLSFDDAKANFFVAARYDLHGQLTWLDGKTQSAASLIREHLLPLARQGLRSAQVDVADTDRYLGIIAERVRTRQTGARWMLKSLAAMEAVEPRDLRYREIAARMLQNQKLGQPVHEWDVIETRADVDWTSSYQTVGQFMSTDLFTVRADDLVDLAASVMDWRHVRHVPVEDESGRLVGIVTHRALLHLLSQGKQIDRLLTVRDIMKTDPLTVSPTTPTLEALEIMQSHHVGCLPVVEAGQLVGILTSYDFLVGASRLFREHLSKASAKAIGHHA